jgi:heptaprenyl diphosphate synthase
MFLLYRAGVKPAATVSLLRICLSSVLFGGLFSAVYSLAGAVFSMTAMVLLKRTKAFGTVGVSTVGGVMHNLGQIIAAVFLVENEKIVFYLPVLSAAGVVSGVVIGVLTGILLQKMPSKFY